MMKAMFTKSIISISLSLAVSFSCAAQDTFLGIGNDRCSEFHIVSVSRRPGGLIEVFERIKPVDGKLPDFRLQIINTRQGRNLSTEGFENVGYYRRKLRYDCYTREYCVMEVAYYDLYGNKIAEDPTRGLAQWFPVPEATMREKEFLSASRLASRR